MNDGCKRENLRPLREKKSGWDGPGKGRCMMTAKMRLLLILISMAFLAGELGGSVLVGYLMALRDNRKNQVKKG